MPDRLGLFGKPRAGREIEVLIELEPSSWSTGHMRASGVHHGPQKRWRRRNAAGLGMLLGLGVAVVHSMVFHPLWQDHVPDDPMPHILLDYVAFAAAGTFLLVVAAEIRNRLRQGK